MNFQRKTFNLREPTGRGRQRRLAALAGRMMFPGIFKIARPAGLSP